MSNRALLEFVNVSKVFGDCIANQNVSFQVMPGTIHALVGENGAGKSTIMKTLFGLYQRDSGEIRIRGQQVQFKSPLEAKRHGIGMVHQHFMLAGPLTALDHIFLDESRVGSLFKPLPRRQRLEEMQALSQKYGMPVPWNDQIENLAVGFQQRVEILKLLYNQAEILILDEPTAVLTPQEIESLFHQLRELRSAGKTILLITHKLKEVMSLADAVTVFRQGTVVQTVPVSQTSATELSEWMIGRKLQDLPSNRSPTRKAVGLSVSHLNVPAWKLHDLDFQIQLGEILGIAGIEGNGQSELIECLLHPGKVPGMRGDLQLNGQSIRASSSRDLKTLGFSFFPEDRHQQGSLLNMNLQENFLLGQHRSPVFQKWGWLRKTQIRQVTDQEMDHLDVRPRNSELLFQSLSGGNQQKLVVARELYRRPRFLLAAQPTRGVDIGAIERIHREILQLREQGASILLISSDLDELMKLSDRLLVMFQGKIVGELERKNFDEMRIGKMMTGVQT